MAKVHGKRLSQWLTALALLTGVFCRAAPADIADLCGKLTAHTFGQDRTFISDLQDALKQGDAATRTAVETGLIGILTNAEATVAARHYACRILRDYGSAKAVPALAKLLTSAESAQIALFALDGIPGKEAAAALRDSLGDVTPAIRAAALTALGRRRDADAVPLAARYASDADRAVADAALFALGQIGTAASATALLGMTVPKPLQTDWNDACLYCAEHLLRVGAKPAAEAIYKRLFGPDMPAHVRAAALGGLAELGSAEAINALLNMLKSDDVALQQGAVAMLPKLSGKAAMDSLIKALPELQQTAQITVVRAIATEDNPSVLPALRRMLKGAGDDLLAAIVAGLGSLGDAEDAPVLAELAGRRGAVGQAAESALTALGGDGITKALLGSANAGEAPARAAAIRALTARGAGEAVTPFLKLARDADATVRREAVKGLAELASGSDLPALVDVLVSPRSSSDEARLLTAVTAVAEKMQPKSRAIEVLLARRDGADEGGQAAITRGLGRLGGEEALASVRSELAAGPVRREAAVRALADWPDAAPLDDLEGLARASESNLERVLAMRGYLRLLTLPSKRPQADTTARLKTGMSLARSAAERKLVLGQVGGMADGAGLELAAPLMNDPEVGEDAAATVLRLLKNLGLEPLRSQASAVKTIAESTHKKPAREAKKILAALGSPVYEAEKARLTKAIVNSNHKGFSGKGFVNFHSGTGGAIEWNVGIGEAGQYTLIFRYALGGGSRSLNITVDGKLVAEKQDFKGTGWSSWATVELNVPLSKGVHTVRAECAVNDGPNLDWLKVVRAAE